MEAEGKVTVGIVAVALIAGAVLLAESGDKADVGTADGGMVSADVLDPGTRAVLTKDVPSDKLGTSKLGVFDGSVATYTELDSTDGGAPEKVVLDAPPCARRPAGSKPSDCTLVGGGDPGDSNRYRSALLVGPGCEPVACSVWAGQDSEL